MTQESPTVVVATSNAGKVREIAEALAPLGWHLRALGPTQLPEETGETYEENAALKAHAAAQATGLPALADDSGLEVEALPGELCVRSARFGDLRSDAERNQLLLSKLQGQSNRRARFISVVVLAFPDGTQRSYRGEVAGTLLEQPRGSEGFGYDPLFVPQGESRTFAEMSTTEKKALSHRGRALEGLLADQPQVRPSGGK